MLVRTTLVHCQRLGSAAHDLRASHTQPQASTAHLRAVASASHVAVAIGLLGAAVQLVATEALSAVLGSGQREALLGTVSSAVGCSDLLTPPSEGFAGQCTATEGVGVAASGGPARWQGGVGGGARGRAS